MSEQNRKTLRSFYCRDYLWELFEVMTRDLGCSMDYLINEAMRHYARSRNYSLTSGQGGGSGAGLGGGNGSFGAPPGFDSGQGFPGASGGGAFGQPQLPPGDSGLGLGGVGAVGAGALAAPPGVYGSAPRGSGFEHRTFERMPAAQRSASPFGANPGAAPVAARPATSPVAAATAPVMPPPPVAPPPPAAAAPRFPVAAPPPPRPAPAPPPPPMPAKAPPPPAPAPAPPVAAPAPAAVAASGRPQLSLIFNGQRYPVSKDKFIIGRASQMTDLTIRDGNISRKHCAIIFRGGQYYIKDLDSTNGIEYKGNRIDSKKIEEGDIFHICDYELRFSYR